jgi:hypothetical protein
MPPLMMTKVMPSAPRATMTDCVATLLRLPGSKNRSWTWGSREKMRMTRIRPMKGPRKLISSLILLLPALRSLIDLSFS